MARPLRICLCAGEPSGDRHAAALLTELRAMRSDLTVEAVGGPHLEAAGAVLLQRVESLSALGFTEPLSRLVPHLVLLAALKRRFAERRYDLVIPVDYPGFNLRVARAATGAKIPVLYYIAPQTWAWAPQRTEALRRAVRALAVILPFEQEFFASRGVPARFVGHPLLDTRYPPREEARASLGLGRDPVLGVFPGSRPPEVHRLWPIMRDAIRRVRRRRPDVECVVAAVRGCRYPGGDEVRLEWDASGNVLAAADAALCKCGTTTLEAALVGVPGVIAYAVHPISYAIARRVVRVPHVGLVNLLAERRVVPELIQREARPDRIAETLLPLLDGDGRAAREQRAGLAQVRERLGSPGAARRAAAMALEQVA